MHASRILYLTDSTEHGGAEDHLRLLASQFHKRGQEVRVLLPDAPGMRGLNTQIGDEGVQVSPLPLVAIHPGAIRQTRKAVPLNIMKLYRCFREIKPDLIHFVVSWPTRDNWCGMVAALLLRIPYVVDFQLVPPSIQCPPTNRGLLKQLGRILKFVFNRADRLICVSGGNKSRLSQLFGINEKRIEVVHNCIAMEPFKNPVLGSLGRLRKELGLSPDRIVITTVARLNNQKGHSHLIEAAKSVAANNPQVMFLLVGDGELRGKLEIAVENARLSDKFMFAGYRQEIPEISALTDIFVLPTLFEGLPHAVLEAMAAGRCVVASRVDGVDEVVAEGETGILVEAGNSNQLADALISLVNNKELREEMGRRGRIRVSKLFALDRMIEKVESIYATIRPA